jgi:hypothetical protein
MAQTILLCPKAEVFESYDPIAVQIGLRGGYQGFNLLVLSEIKAEAEHVALLASVSLCVYRYNPNLVRLTILKARSV